MAHRRPLLLSLLIVMAYALCGWAWFRSNSIGLVGSVIFIPFVVAYHAGYAAGDPFFWPALAGQLLVMWLVIYGSLRALRQP